MSKNICLFQARWLGDKRFKHWIRKKSSTVAICNYCSKIAYTGEAAFASYMKGKKQVKRPPSYQCIKSLMLPAPAPPLIILKISLSEACSFQ